MTHPASEVAEKGRRRSIVVDGTRMDRPRRCYCGRVPAVTTGYKGYEGDGPFLILCEHGEPERDRYVLSRSWFKSRAVRNWNRIVRAHLASEGAGG